MVDYLNGVAQPNTSAALNPTAYSVSTPTNAGYFRATGDQAGQVVYQVQNGQVLAYKLSDSPNSGLNWGALPEQNLADVLQANKQYDRGAIFNVNNVIQPAPSLTSGSTTMNGTAPTEQVVPQGTAIQNPATALPNNGGQVNQYQLLPGETIPQYNARIAAMNPNLPAPGTTSSAGVTNTAISGEMLRTPTSYNFQTPANFSNNVTGAQASAAATAASVAQQQAAYSETPAQKQESDLIAVLQGLNTQEAGKSAAQAKANADAGVDTRQATVNDLSAKLATLTNEAAAIRMTPQQGEGVTTAIDNRQRDGALQTNAIAALAVSSLLNAANASLATAQALANKVVALIFDPIEAQIKADMANLRLIQNDPKTILEEQKQLQAQLDIKNAQSDAIALQKQNLKDVLDFANTAAANYAANPKSFIATAQYPTASMALSAMQQAHSVADAAMIAASTGLGGGSTTGTWGAPYLLGGDYVQRNSLTGQIRTAVNVSTSNSTPSSTTNYSKGTMSNKQFVEISLERQNLSYDSVIARIPQGKMGVVDNKTGQVGYIDPTEYNTKTYTQL